ncbi:MAG: coproporphyrinogen III oxidase [Rhodospirillaceae bacterium]|nr:coproporphyrinogen III oxidase [Rhodospirillaceae bacterium]
MIAAIAADRGNLGASDETGGFGLYVHWPFCVSKCPYCDFNSHVREKIDEGRWREALLTELDYFGRMTAGRSVTSVFFGGGTPSLMQPATVAAVLDRAARHWSLGAQAEINLEANPNSADADRFAGFRLAGVNRLSLGIQALDAPALKFLGRAHDRDEALAAIALASRLFPRFSFDLIYTRPEQTAAAWRAELREALALAGDHLSLYQLTIEKGTAFYGLHARGDIVLPNEDDSTWLYETTQEMLDEAGLPAYEVSNHARPGGECRHNLTYWRSGDWVGIGPGAHGRLTISGERLATAQARAPEAWLAAVEAAGHATVGSDVIVDEHGVEEVLMMGLRLHEGVGHKRFRTLTRRSFEDVLDSSRLATLIDGGFLVLDEAGLRATPAGMQRLNAVLAVLLG